MIRPGPPIQPLFEYRSEFAGYGTRVLELEGDGPPLVFFHGYADSADTWRLVLALLARRGQRALAVDLPGFGRADPLGSEPILPQLDAFAGEVLRVAGGRPRRRAVLVGNSLGGCLALRTAERHGDRVAGVYAAAPAGLDISRLIFLIERDPVLHSILALPAPVPSMVLRAAVARLYVQLAFASARGIDQHVISTFTSHIANRATAARYLAIAHRLPQELREALAPERVSPPVLLVWGDRDRMLMPRGAEQLLAKLPDGSLELLHGIGHCPQVEVPERFTELLVGFISSLEERAVAARNRGSERRGTSERRRTGSERRGGRERREPREADGAAG
jgi:pimeloyl-ACP methyl ester carboxylesterase